MSLLDPDLSYFEAALRSLLEQSLEDLEIIILEDPSPRCAAQLISDLADPRIRYQQNCHRVSLAESRNQTLQMARADYVAIMDADDICRSDRLEKQVAFLECNQDVSILGSQVAVISADGSLRGYRAYPCDHAHIHARMRRSNPLAHPSIMMRRAAALGAGGYSLTAGQTCDDYELWSRLATKGHRFANHPEALLEYRVHDASMKSRLLRQTLVDSIRVKRQYWRGQMNLGDHMRILGEKALRWLPPRWVSELYLRMTISPHLRVEQNPEGRIK